MNYNTTPKRMQSDKIPAAREVEQGHEYLYWVYSVEKLENNEGLFFRRKPKYSKLPTVLNM